MKSKPFAILIVALLSLCMTTLFGCSESFMLVRREKDYSDFLENLKFYEDAEKPNVPVNPSKPDETDAEFFGPEIVGFYPLYRVEFDYASACGGNFVFAKKDGYGVALGKDGEVVDVGEDFEETELTSDKYVFLRDKLCGVKNIYGNVIVPAVYNSVNIIGETVAAYSDDRVDIYVGGEIKSSSREPVELVSEDFLLGVRGVYDLEMNPVFCGGYRMVLPPVNGIGIIDGGGLFGYGSVSGEVLTEPRYKSVSDFRFGYAAVVTRDNRNVIIDLRGNEIIESSNADIRLKTFDGTYLIYSSLGSVYVSDKDMNGLTPDAFDNIADDCIYGGYFITDNGTRVYSINEGGYASERFSCVTFRDGLFVAEHGNGEYTVYDGKFEPIADELEYACFEYGVLTVKYNGKYYLYAAE